MHCTAMHCPALNYTGLLCTVPISTRLQCIRRLVSWKPKVPRFLSQGSQASESPGFPQVATDWTDHSTAQSTLQLITAQSTLQLITAQSTLKLITAQSTLQLITAQSTLLLITALTIKNKEDFNMKEILRVEDPDITNKKLEQLLKS